MTQDLYRVVRGKVVSIKNYGAFLSIDGSSKQGLLHRSQISNHAIDKIEDVLEIGEEVYCKVISAEDGKIGLSMKLVDQTTGRDKDKDNVAAVRLSERRKGGGRDMNGPIELGAVLDTVCKRCSVKGHLAANCFAQVGAETLGLVYTDSEDGPSNSSSESDSRKSKRPKHKKRKVSETNVVKYEKKTKKDKKQHKEKKHQKHKHRSSKEKNSCRKKHSR
ncbi:Nucleolar protein of [Fasciola hepatica]|uniref:Nucleolar protein of n=1 Tax=Fasciola hepatica TaxID=6192 RepID=A0A4E0RTR4_FASHE|nr:Nucleolar protein of [Fasciola hepatica]